MFVKYFVCVTLFHSHKIHRKILILMHFCFKDSHLKGLNISKKTCFSAIILNRICYRLESLEWWFQNAAISKGEKHYFLVKNIEPETKKFNKFTKYWPKTSEKFIQFRSWQWWNYSDSSCKYELVIDFRLEAVITF